MTIQAQFIVFVGTLTNGKKGKPPEEQTVTVLAGEGAPTPIAGWPEWVTLPRAQRVGLTTLQTYPPIEMEIPVRFEALLEKPPRMDVEREIQKLEWMAGRGRIALGHKGGVAGGVFTGHPGHDALGDSPLLEIHTTDGSKNVALMPIQFQSLRWVITNIQYDKTETGCKRDTGGARVRQLAVVFVRQHVESPGTSFDSPSVRFRARNQGGGMIVSTTSALNTINRIAIRYTKTAATAQEILQNNRGNKKIGSDPRKELPVGTRVYIPYNALHHLTNG